MSSLLRCVFFNAGLEGKCQPYLRCFYVPGDNMDDDDGSGSGSGDPEPQR